MKNNLNLVDLHIHSVFSDGTDAVEELLKKIDEKQITIFSVTDHDTLKFYDHTDDKSLEGLNLIPGIEFSCITEAGQCHILGYGIDINCKLLRDTLSYTQSMRKKKLSSTMTLLKVLYGIVFTDEEKNILSNIPSVGKPHIAQMLVKKGYAAL